MVFHIPVGLRSFFQAETMGRHAPASDIMPCAHASPGDEAINRDIYDRRRQAISRIAVIVRTPGIDQIAARRKTCDEVMACVQMQFRFMGFDVPEQLRHIRQRGRI